MFFFCVFGERRHEKWFYCCKPASFRSLGRDQFFFEDVQCVRASTVYHDFFPRSLKSDTIAVVADITYDWMQSQSPAKNPFLVFRASSLDSSDKPRGWRVARPLHRVARANNDDVGICDSNTGRHEVRGHGGNGRRFLSLRKPLASRAATGGGKSRWNSQLAILSADGCTTGFSQSLFLPLFPCTVFSLSLTPHPSPVHLPVVDCHGFRGAPTSRSGCVPVKHALATSRLTYVSAYVSGLYLRYVSPYGCATLTHNPPTIGIVSLPLPLHRSVSSFLFLRLDEFRLDPLKWTMRSAAAQKCPKLEVMILCCCSDMCPVTLCMIAGERMQRGKVIPFEKGITCAKGFVCKVLTKIDSHEINQSWLYV